MPAHGDGTSSSEGTTDAVGTSDTGTDAVAGSGAIRPDIGTAAAPGTGTAAAPGTGTAAAPGTGTAAAPGTGAAAASKAGTAAGVVGKSLGEDAKIDVGTARNIKPGVGRAGEAGPGRAGEAGPGRAGEAGPGRAGEAGPSRAGGSGASSTSRRKTYVKRKNVPNDESDSDEEETDSDEDETDSDEDETDSDEDETDSDEDETYSDEDESDSDEDESDSDEDGSDGNEDKSDKNRDSLKNYGKFDSQSDEAGSKASAGQDSDTTAGTSSTSAGPVTLLTTSIEKSSLEGSLAMPPPTNPTPKTSPQKDIKFPTSPGKRIHDKKSAPEEPFVKKQRANFGSSSSSLSQPGASCSITSESSGVPASAGEPSKELMVVPEPEKWSPMCVANPTLTRLLSEEPPSIPQLSKGKGKAPASSKGRKKSRKASRKRRKSSRAGKKKVLFSRQGPSGAGKKVLLSRQGPTGGVKKVMLPIQGPGRQGTPGRRGSTGTLEMLLTSLVPSTSGQREMPKRPIFVRRRGFDRSTHSYLRQALTNYWYRSLRRCNPEKLLKMQEELCPELCEEEDSEALQGEALQGGAQQEEEIH